MLNQKKKKKRKSSEILSLLTWNDYKKTYVPGHRIRTICNNFLTTTSDKLSLAAQIVHVGVGRLMYTNRNLIYHYPTSSLTHRTSPYPIVNYPKDNFFLGCYKYTSIFQSLRNIFKHLHPSSESKSNFKQVAQTLNKKKKREKKERVLFPFLSDRCSRKKKKKYFIACIKKFC